MPILRILTNIPNDKIPKDFVHKVRPVLSKTLKMDPDVFIIIIAGGCQATFGGDSTSPSAVATLESVANVDPENNKITGRELSNFVEKELGIIPDRFLMSINEVKGVNIVKNGITH